MRISCVHWLLLPQASMAVQVRSITPGPLPSPGPDGWQIEQVLINLLRNAWQATESIDKPVIRLSGRLNRRHNVVIEVADNGPGIPADIATKIFVPFFTTREKGSGVGLALARQVMIAHGGFIRVNSGDDGGSVFSLTF